MSELKPCAHCGENPVIQHTSDSLFIGGKLVYWVVCPKCGIRTQKNKDQSEAIEAWNRRENEQPDRGYIEQMQKGGKNDFFSNSNLMGS